MKHLILLSCLFLAACTAQDWDNIAQGAAATGNAYGNGSTYRQQLAMQQEHNFQIQQQNMMMMQMRNLQNQQ